MDKAEFAHDLETRGFKMVNNVRAVGLEQGSPIAVTWGGKNQVSVMVYMTAEDWKASKKDLKAGLKGLASIAWLNDHILAGIKTKNLTDVYTQGIQPVVRALRDNRVEVKDACAICGQSHCDMASPMNGGAYRPVHRACLEGQVSGVKAKAVKNAQSGSYITGTIGAFLGMLVGTLPSVLSILWASMISAWLFALIPLGAYTGYKLCKGKMNRFALVISILFSILGVYVLGFIQIFYELATADYLLLTFGQALSLMPAAIGDPSMWQLITEESVMEFVFVALGIFIAWGQISRTSQTEVLSAESLLTASVPYGIGAPARDDYFDSSAY